MGAGMQFDKEHVIHTKGDGVLGDTDAADVSALVARLADQERVVIHLHGGLVNKSRALEIAERLTPEYLGTHTYPVFMVWESGLFDSIFNNLREISEEPIFQTLLKKLLKWKQ